MTTYTDDQHRLARFVARIHTITPQQTARVTMDEIARLIPRSVIDAHARAYLNRAKVEDALARSRALEHGLEHGPVRAAANPPAEMTEAESKAAVAKVNHSLLIYFFKHEAHREGLDDLVAAYRRNSSLRHGNAA